MMPGGAAFHGANEMPRRGLPADNDNGYVGRFSNIAILAVMAVVVLTVSYDGSESLQR